MVALSRIGVEDRFPTVTATPSLISWDRHCPVAQRSVSERCSNITESSLKMMIIIIQREAPIEASCPFDEKA
jgi:hypothetical protein